MRILNNVPIYIGISLIIGCGFKTEAVDLIIHNAIITTMDARGSRAQAMAIRDGKIIELGAERQILNKYRAEETIDAGQQYVYPGLIDAHCHFLGYGLGLTSANLVGTNSWEEVVQKVSDHSKAYPNDWLIGRGWDQNDWGRPEFPTADTLDLLFPDRPVMLRRIDGHAAIVNAKAMELAKVDPTQKIDGGSFIFEDGEFTGVIIDNAIDLVARALPQADRETKRRALLEAEADCFAVGLTTVDDAGLSKDDVALIMEMQESGELKMRIYVMLSDTEENIEHFLESGPIRNERLSVCAFKFYADGALGSRGACLLSNYTDQITHQGFMLDSIEHFRLRAMQLKQHGFQMNTHCIGDSANRALLDIYAEVLGGSNDLRWRIEHAQVVHHSDREKFGQYSIIPSIQPTHATSDMYWAELRLGRNRIRRAYAYQDLLAQNGMLALGTDFPVEGISPFNTYYAAVTRQDTSGYPAEGFMTSQRLSPTETLMGMTIWAAMANFEDSLKGSLEPGKYADLIIVDRDLLKSQPKDVLETKVLRTMVNGESVFHAK